MDFLHPMIYKEKVIANSQGRLMQAFATVFAAETCDNKILHRR
jgi:hypothetical protein